MNPDQLSLAELIEICADRSNCDWRKGWNEFLVRYKYLLYYFIIHECKTWRIRRIETQIKDVTDDIFSEVLNLLLMGLDTFNSRDSKAAFISWLQVICMRATKSHLTNLLGTLISREDLRLFRQYKVQHTEMKQLELYEHMIHTLRLTHNKSDYTERDIHVFLLKTWSGFPVKHILKHPALHGLTENVLDVIISRMRKNIKNSFSL
jgi:hypothetical protein